MGEELKDLSKRFISIANTQLCGDLSKVDAHELGEVIDMIKDLAEADYYCAVAKAMEEAEPEDAAEAARYYTETGWRKPRVTTRYRNKDIDDYTRMRDMDRETMGRMYYSSPISSGDNMNNHGGNYTRDYREGRSPLTRRMYMEMKENGSDKATKQKELEHYMQELSEDITEMINGATPDEKALLKQKITALAGKIA